MVTGREREVEIRIAALVLGDGHITKNGKLTIKHSISQEGYLDSKASELRGLGFRVSIRRVAPSGYGKQECVRADTNVDPLLRKMRERFYPYGRKTAPADYISKFGWPEWAIVFQDDGRANVIRHYNVTTKGGSVRKDCEAFVNRYEMSLPTLSGRETNLILDRLAELGVEASLIYQRRTSQYQIAIMKAASKNRFFDGVLPHIHQDLAYKIAVRPSCGHASLND